MSDMSDKIDALERRVKQLEDALQAVAMRQPIGCNTNGIIALTQKEHFEQMQYPDAKPQ